MLPLPASRLHQLGQRRSVGPPQQLEDRSGFATVPRGTCLFRGLGRFLGTGALLPRLGLGGRNVRTLRANTGLLLGFRLFGKRLGGSGSFNSCDHVISFSGGFRDHMNHSSPPTMQVNSEDNREGRMAGDGGLACGQVVADGFRW